MNFVARVAAAMAAEVNISLFRAISEFTLPHPIIYIVNQATIAVCRPACAAEEATCTVL